MKHFAFFMLLMLFAQQSFSQHTFAVKGSTSIAEGDFYYVTILSLRDSTILEYQFFDTPGFEMGNLKIPEFILQVTSPLLYKTYSVPVYNKERQPLVDVGFIQLESVAHLLDAVTVTGMRPRAKVADGKLVYEIQNNKDLKTLNSLDNVLRRLPFVSVNNGKIDVFGKRNTVVLINGIPPKNDNWELISPDDIKDIEVITNPSAEYNAGGAAVVNIITRKSFVEGFSGQLSAGVSKGDFWRSNNVLQLGYATQKLNLFTSLGYNPGKKRYVESYQRYFSTGEEMYNTVDEERSASKDHNLIFGFDYVPHPNHMLSAQYQRMYEAPERTIVNHTETIYPEHPSQQFGISTNGNMRKEKNIYDFNYTIQLDSLGKNIAVNVGYVDYTGGENNRIEIVSAGKAGAKESYSRADIRLFTANVDYLHLTRNNLTGKAGVYYSNSCNDSRYALSGDIPLDNSVRISESKMAAYLTGRKNWRRFYLSAGVRYEYVYNSNFFPSVEAGYDVTEDLKTNLSLSRKVSYPSFQDLDPTIQYVDTFTYHMGNTSLRPEFSYNASFNLVYKRMVTLSLAYSRISDPINPLFIQRLNPQSIISITSTQNLERQDTWTASLSFPFQYKVWTMMNAIGCNYNRVKYQSEGVLRSQGKAMGYVYSYNGFTLPRGFNLSVIYQYNTSGMNGIIYYSPRHLVNASLNKSFLNDKLSFTLQYDDVLRSGKQKARTEISGIQLAQQADYDTSFVSLSLRYKFGSGKKYDVKENSKDELKRIK